MVTETDPTVQRRRLTAELRKARRDAGLTQRDVANAMDWSVSKLNRIEGGDVGITTNDLKALLSHYGIRDRRVDTLLELARGGKGQPTWSDYKDVLAQPVLNFFRFEASAWIGRFWEPEIIPGTLQIEEYAIALLSRYRPTEEAARVWDARKRRQEMHERANPPQMFYLVGEAAVRIQVGGAGVMRRQLERLKYWADQPHITFRVIPFSAGAHWGLRGAFTHLEFVDPNDADLIYLENAGGDTVIRDSPDETTPYLNGFFALEDIALSQKESLGLLDELIGEMSGAAPTPPTPPPAPAVRPGDQASTAPTRPRRRAPERQ